MADVSLDKTDPNILKIRPITDDLITKFQLERPIILAYKVWTPFMPFTYKTVAALSTGYWGTRITIPYEIQSITGIWYYKYTDIMDDDQRFVRETIMEKGDPVVGYRILPCETYDGVEYCNQYIYFDVPLTSRKIWIEGVGKGIGYLEASETSLEPIGDFILERYNVYSLTQQRVIPDSGSKELPYRGNNVGSSYTYTRNYWTNPQNGDWRGPDVCHCIYIPWMLPDYEPWCFSFPTERGYIWEESTITQTTHTIQSSTTSLLTLQGTHAEIESDITNIHEDCHDTEAGNYSKKQTYRATSTYSGETLSGYAYGIQSTYHSSRWMAHYTKYTGQTAHTYDMTESGQCQCYLLGAICAGGCNCHNAQSTTNYTTDSKGTIILNVNGSEREIASGFSISNQIVTMLCSPLDEYTYEYPPATGSGDEPRVNANYSCQKKRFEVENTLDAILGGYYTWKRLTQTTGTETTVSYHYSPNYTIFKNDEYGFIEKTVPYNAEAEYQQIQGLDTYYELTYVRL